MIASVDHVLFSTLLTPQILADFNFKFFNINTYDVYLNEIKYFDDDTKMSKGQNGDSLKFIFRSLTKYQK